MFLIDFLIDPTFLPRYILSFVENLTYGQIFVASFIESTGFPVMLGLAWGTNNVDGAIFKSPMLEISMLQVISGLLFARLILGCFTFFAGKKMYPITWISFTKDYSRTITMIGASIPLFGWILPFFTVNTYTSLYLFLRDYMIGAIGVVIVYSLAFALMDKIYLESISVRVAVIGLMVFGIFSCVRYLKKQH